MVNNLIFGWPKHLFFMLLGAHGKYVFFLPKKPLYGTCPTKRYVKRPTSLPCSTCRPICCCWLLVVGCWLLVVGCWLLVVGCWLLVVGCCCCCCCWLLLLLLLLLSSFFSFKLSNKHFCFLHLRVFTKHPTRNGPKTPQVPTPRPHHERPIQRQGPPLRRRFLDVKVHPMLVGGFNPSEISSPIFRVKRQNI